MGTQPENTHGIQTQTQPNPYPNFGSGSGITLGYLALIYTNLYHNSFFLNLTELCTTLFLSFNNDVGSYISIAAGLELTH